MGWYHNELFIPNNLKKLCELCKKNIAIFGKSEEDIKYCGKCCNTKKKSGREINVTAMYLGKYYVRTWWIDIFRQLFNEKKQIFCNMLGNIKSDEDKKQCTYMMNAYLKNQKINPFKEFNINNYLTCGTINAIIIIPNNIEIFFKDVGAKTRNMIRKAKKNDYYTNEFNWNEYLDDIYQINISKDKRCGKKINNSLKIFPEKKEIYKGKYHFHLYFGIFKEDKLVAYTNIRCHNDTSIITRFLSHSEHSKFGIMNLLIYETVKLFIEKYQYIKYFIYCEYNDSQSKNLLNFKRRNGFKPYITYFKYH